MFIGYFDGGGLNNKIGYTHSVKVLRRNVLHTMVQCLPCVAKEGDIFSFLNKRKNG